MEHDCGMKSENEFTKPLKRIEERETPSRGKGMLAAFAICTVCALPIVYFHGGFAGFGSQK